ncbi:MAG: hypothetical protein FWF84_03570 [Kiritimatiellaeota bacterium]|nr:hypothetical protein [Kiritimatiellota bacterium]
MLLCLLLFGVLQVLLAYNARTLAHHAAARTARARAVGLNGWMQEKVMRVASIPASGKRLYRAGEAPAFVPVESSLSLGERMDRAMNFRRRLPLSAQAMEEVEAIALYMTMRTSDAARFALNYEAWEEGRLGMAHRGKDHLMEVSVQNRYPLEMPLHRLFYRTWDDAITVRGEAAEFEHYQLYLDGQGW